MLVCLANKIKVAADIIFQFQFYRRFGGVIRITGEKWKLADAHSYPCIIHQYTVFKYWNRRVSLQSWQMNFWNKLKSGNFNKIDFFNFNSVLTFLYSHPKIFNNLHWLPSVHPYALHLSLILFQQWLNLHLNIRYRNPLNW